MRLSDMGVDPQRAADLPSTPLLSSMADAGEVGDAARAAVTAVYETRKIDEPEGVRWEAGAGTDIEMSASAREQPGTTVTLYLKPSYQALAA